MGEFTGHNDLRTYLRILWRWKLLFLVFVIAAPLAAYFIESGKPKSYRSTALVGVNATTVDTALLNGGASFSTSNVQAIAELVTTTPVASIAASLLNPPTAAGAIVGEVTATGDPTTNFLTITAQDPSPVRAATIANAFARAIGLNRQDAAIKELNGTISGVQSQLSHLSRKDVTTRPGLQQQLNQLRAAKAAQSGDAAILQPATPSGVPTGLATRRTVELGLIIGLLLGFGAIALAENADRRLRTPDDLEGLTDLPLLAAIPSKAFSGKLDTSPEDEEAFQMLRTSLMYFNIDQHLSSIVITSPGEKDGKTTVAIRLALATARAGLRVILVDSDLRRAQVSSRLGIHAQEGLGAVIGGRLTLSDAIVDYAVPDSGEGQLRVLPAGPPPPNPSALISSEAMQNVLNDLCSQSDLVIVDTPAALAVSDPLPLMRSVTGVVLVARMNRSSRETIRRLQRIIESAHGKLIGVVATGVSSGPGYDSYSPKYYTQNGSGERGLRNRLRLRRKRSHQMVVLRPPKNDSDAGTPLEPGASAGAQEPAGAQESSSSTAAQPADESTLNSTSEA
ncbi:MAG: polysaccharide biosynthesis tyrosine autokinase [Solirubrobacteraceae bacterium]